MRNRQQNTGNDCIAVIGSMTQTMRAQNVLAMAAIRTEVIKADSSLVRRGCAYALLYACAQDENVRDVLSNAGIRVKSFHRGGGGS